MASSDRLVNHNESMRLSMLFYISPRSSMAHGWCSFMSYVGVLPHKRMKAKETKSACNLILILQSILFVTFSKVFFKFCFEDSFKCFKNLHLFLPRSLESCMSQQHLFSILIILLLLLLLLLFSCLGSNRPWPIQMCFVFSIIPAILLWLICWNLHQKMRTENLHHGMPLKKCHISSVFWRSILIILKRTCKAPQWGIIEPNLDQESLTPSLHNALNCGVCGRKENPIH